MQFLFTSHDDGLSYRSDLDMFTKKSTICYQNSLWEFKKQCKTTRYRDACPIVEAANSCKMCVCVSNKRYFCLLYANFIISRTKSNTETIKLKFVSYLLFSLNQSAKNQLKIRLKTFCTCWLSNKRQMLVSIRKIFHYNVHVLIAFVHVCGTVCRVFVFLSFYIIHMHSPITHMLRRNVFEILFKSLLPMFGIVFHMYIFTVKQLDRIGFSSVNRSIGAGFVSRKSYF